MTRTASPPNKLSVPRYVREETLEVRYSPGGNDRAVLTRDEQGLIRVHFETWYVEEADDHYPGSWIPVGRTATITDSMENARAISNSRFRNDTTENGDA
jgi:hypothetical protein